MKNCKNSQHLEYGISRNIPENIQNNKNAQFFGGKAACGVKYIQDLTQF